MNNEIKPEAYLHEIAIARCILIGLAMVILGFLHGCWIHNEWSLRTEALRLGQHEDWKRKPEPPTDPIPAGAKEQK